MTATRSKTIERAMQSRPGVVAEYWAEDECAAPWWVRFEGFTYDNPGQHSYNGTAAQLATYIRGAVPCNCEDCRKARQ